MLVTFLKWFFRYVPLSVTLPLLFFNVKITGKKNCCQKSPTSRAYRGLWFFPKIFEKFLFSKFLCRFLRTYYAVENWTMRHSLCPTYFRNTLYIYKKVKKIMLHNLCSKHDAKQKKHGKGWKESLYRKFKSIWR